MKRPEWELPWEHWDCNQVISRLRRRQKSQVCPICLNLLLDVMGNVQLSEDCLYQLDCLAQFFCQNFAPNFCTTLNLTWICLGGRGGRCPGWWSGNRAGKVECSQSSERFQPEMGALKSFIVSAPCRRAQFWSHMQIAAHHDSSMWVFGNLTCFKIAHFH